MHQLIKLNLMGNTILLVTHEEKYADLCSRKIVISDGRILSDTRPRKIRSESSDN